MSFSWASPYFTLGLADADMLLYREECTDIFRSTCMCGSKHAAKGVLSEGSLCKEVRLDLHVSLDQAFCQLLVFYIVWQGIAIY